ncbi:MAG TPA: L,D-transpeptidase [Rhizobiales bacterium]|nr:L,D-transpeptidase [Hyphomicrobiales bacterium]
MNLNPLKNPLLAAAIIAGAAFTGTGTIAQAGVDVNINLATQRMNVSVDGNRYATYKISSGRRGYTTPTGRYGIQRMEKMHYSRKYDNAPMPNSIFFRGGYAIHGTNSISRLGRVASHGCVRLHPDNARELYNLIQSKGRRNTKIRVYRGKKMSIAKAGSKKQANRKRVHIASKSKPFFIFGGLNLSD